MSLEDDPSLKTPLEDDETKKNSRTTLYVA